MIQVRRNVFETNSSSTHSICIVTDDRAETIYPSKFIFKCGQFGWEFRNYNDPVSKGQYFYTGLCELYGKEKIREVMRDIEQYFKTEHNIDVFVDEPDYRKSTYNGKEYEYIDSDCGYIDHVTDAQDLIDALVQDKELLIDFLFKDASFVATGNDNAYEEERMTMEVPPYGLEYKEFYKGN